MIKLRQLLPLATLLALAAAAPLAQPEKATGGETPSAPVDPAPEPGQASTDNDNDKEQPARNESPFEYRPSEEISEDLPVSFPVDI